jgi:succinate dehydrogenase / fumarate reductase, cytochrome b subunit
MLTWLRRTLSSSLGKKYLVALSGFLLAAFLVVHLAENLILFVGGNGAAFNEYAHFLISNPLLPIAEVALAAAFLVHIAFAIRVTFENRRARKDRYAIASSKGKRTLASSSMIFTGLVVLLFLLVHLYDFRIGKDSAGALATYGRDPELFDLAGMVRHRLSEPLGAALYLVGVAVLGIHLSHAIRSACQTFGVNHPHLNMLIVRGGIALAILLALGFASFPIYFLVSGGAR